ncbi:MAG: NADH-quinone oxidoreductase subunit C [Chloroflexi bacterium]|nr:NADH-quinone oxidoreductase subunit C [Chloroflexota bacterium]
MISQNRNDLPLATLDRIRELLGPAALSVRVAQPSLVEVVAGKEDLKWIAERLRHDAILSFDFLSCVSAVDYEGHYEVVYHLHSLAGGDSVRLKVKLDGDQPTVDSLCALWPTANWHEREAYDLFGVRFVGHPNLERIMMEEDFEGHPMRKSYPQPEGRSRE